MIYGSVCSGIEAASVAWEPLGWRPAWFAEIEPFPSAVLTHRFPGVPNLGDFTQIGADHGPIDLLVGGTPCQAFSVVGKREGLDDPRGNLTLEFLALAGRLRPRWLVWENVPGVLSIDGGRTFGTVLGTLAKLGYGFAYRVLDAQFFGVPQRRRRVFVVGCLGDWRRAAAVLFERESLSGNPAPRREKGKVAPSIPCRGSAGGGLGTDFDCDGGLIAHEIAGTLKANNGGGGFGSDPSETFVDHSLRAEGFDASEDGTGRGIPLIANPLTARMGKGINSTLDEGQTPIVVDLTQITSPGNYSAPKPGDPCHPLAAGAAPPTVACLRTNRPGEGGIAGDDERLVISPALNTCSGSHHAPDTRAYVVVQESQSGIREHPTAGSLRSQSSGTDCIGSSLRTPTGVRRLTPLECEHLQGFPDNWTLVPYRGKPACDGPRYRALGNSMAVPVMRWIGERIALMEELKPI